MVDVPTGIHHPIFTVRRFLVNEEKQYELEFAIHGPESQARRAACRRPCGPKSGSVLSHPSPLTPNRRRSSRWLSFWS